MNNDVPRRRNLESLKKEARHWLRALESTDFSEAHVARERLLSALQFVPSPPTLRDVQHALAREEGFSGWSELKHALEPDASASTQTIASYEEKANALLDAYRTGTPEALERHYAHTWHRRSWPAMRDYIQLDLGKRAAQNDDEVEITLDNAKFLVAKEHGFENWHALVAFVMRTPGGFATANGLVRVRLQPAHADDREDGAAIIELRDWGTVLRVLAKNPSASLDTNGQMTDEILEQLCRIPHIESLNLGNSKSITIDGARHIARLSGLRTLDLSGTELTDAWLDVLRDLPNLESLSLAMTAVSDTGIAQLAHCNALRNVNLMWTNTGDSAIRALAGKQHLTHFSSGNLLSDDGLALLHELPVFKTWQGGTTHTSLLGFKAEPNQLILRGRFTDNGMRNLRGLDGLFALNLDDSQLAITATGIEPLSSLPHLGSLAVDAKDDWMPHIARLPALQYLGVQDTTATDDGWVALSKSSTIERIWGRRCHNLQTRGFAALATMPKLRGLSVSCLNVTDDGVALLPQFPALRELMPMDIPDSGYRHIARCSELQSLQLMYCRDTTDAATEHIALLPKLERYFNSHTTITDRTPHMLATMQSLQSVTFDACHALTNDGVAQLARLPLLTELRVSGNGLTRDVVSRFPSRIAVHYSP